MTIKHLGKLFLAPAILFASAGALPAQTTREQAAPPAPLPRAQQEAGEPEVLMRGPVHEAFAAPVQLEPNQAEAVPKAPPDPIDEVPPAYKPEGNVVWIPGYWAWDEAASDFVWVSGIWRVPPAGSEWTPGYWLEDANGFIWVSGYWSRADAQVEYLPTPPESLEIGPASPAPAPDQVWVPGSWVWYETNYRWRPGYWVPARAGYIWAPDSYVWTPSGCVFVPGYWDYPLEERGLTFACVRFPHYGYYRPWSPAVVWNPFALSFHLFIGGRSNFFVFGDYYGYNNWRPWYSAWNWRRGYNPIAAFHYYRRDDRWFRDQRDRYDYFRRNEADRPPRRFDERRQAVVASDFAGQTGRGDRGDRVDRGNRGAIQVALAERVDRLAQRRAEIGDANNVRTAVSVVPVAEEQQRALVERATRVRARQADRAGNEGSGKLRAQPAPPRAEVKPVPTPPPSRRVEPGKSAPVERPARVRPDQSPRTQPKAAPPQAAPPKAAPPARPEARPKAEPRPKPQPKAEQPAPKRDVAPRPKAQPKAAAPPAGIEQAPRPRVQPKAEPKTDATRRIAPPAAAPIRPRTSNYPATEARPAEAPRTLSPETRRVLPAQPPQAVPAQPQPRAVPAQPPRAVPADPRVAQPAPRREERSIPREARPPEPPRTLPPETRRVLPAQPPPRAVPAQPPRAVPAEPRVVQPAPRREERSIPREVLPTPPRVQLPGTASPRSQEVRPNRSENRRPVEIQRGSPPGREQRSVERNRQVERSSPPTRRPGNSDSRSNSRPNREERRRR